MIPAFSFYIGLLLLCRTVFWQRLGDLRSGCSCSPKQEQLIIMTKLTFGIEFTCLPWQIKDSPFLLIKCYLTWRYMHLEYFSLVVLPDNHRGIWYEVGCSRAITTNPTHFLVLLV